MATLKIIKVTTPSVVTGDTLASYNVYSDQDGLLANITPAEATAGYIISLTDSLVHQITAKPVGTVTGEFNQPSNIETISTNPVYATTTSSLGMVENDEAESLNNANKLITGLNATPDGITVDGTYFIETPVTALTATDIRLASNVSGELKSNELITTLFPSAGIDNIEIEGVHISDVHATDGDFRLFYTSSTSADSTTLIKFRNNVIDGNVRIYYKDPGLVTDPSTYGVGELDFSYNTVTNNRVYPFTIGDMPIAICNIIGNTINNFDNIFFRMGNSNTHSFESALYTLKPLITYTDNTIINDASWECLSAESGYATPIICEAQRIDAHRNHTEGIWTSLDRAVYDMYLSCNIVDYRNNVNKNNVKFFVESPIVSNTLIKAKGAADDYVNPLRYYEDSQFIVEESWIDQQVANHGVSKAHASVLLFQTGVELENAHSTYIRNNTFNVYSVTHEPSLYAYPIEYEVTGNTFTFGECNHQFTETLVINDDNVAQSVKFENNIFNVSGTVNPAVADPAVVRFADNRTTNTDKVGSFSFTGNTGNLTNYMFVSNCDADVFTFSNNTLSTTPGGTQGKEVMRACYGQTTNISNTQITYTSGVYTLETVDHSPTSVINEDFTIIGTPYDVNNIVEIERGLGSSGDATYKRTLTVDGGDEVYYFEYSLAYDTDHWNVTFIDSGDVERTFRVNNNDGVVEGNLTVVKLYNSGTSNTNTLVKWRNSDGWAGFTQQFVDNVSVTLGVVTVSTVQEVTSLLEFDATNTTPSAGSLTNVVGDQWTVARNSVATYLNGTTVTSVSANVPRIENSKTLIEAQSTNRVLYSEEQDNAAYANLRATISVNATTAPDGNTTADGIISSVDATDHMARQLLSGLTDTQTYAYSVYLKAGGKNWARLWNTSVTDAYADFNLSNGTIGTTGAGATPSIQSIGNGWYRCSITFTLSGTTSSSLRVYVLEADGDKDYAGDGTTIEIYSWGWQCEEVSMTSYIPTTSAIATREADVITVSAPVGSSQYVETLGGVEQSPIAVSGGQTITMKNETNTLVVT